jgi:hypothetical protein
MDLEILLKVVNNYRDSYGTTYSLDLSTLSSIIEDYIDMMEDEPLEEDPSKHAWVYSRSGTQKFCRKCGGDSESWSATHLPCANSK